MAQRRTLPSQSGCTSTCLRWMPHTGGLLKPVVSPSMSRSKGKAILTVAAGERSSRQYLVDCYPGQLRLDCKTVYSPERVEGEFAEVRLLRVDVFWPS